MDKILKGRKNQEEYDRFCKYILPCVAGKKVWDKSAMTTQHMSSLVDLSDEAFALLCLVNGCDRWDEVFEIEQEEEQDKIEKAMEARLQKDDGKGGEASAGKEKDGQDKAGEATAGKDKTGEATAGTDKDGQDKYANDKEDDSEGQEDAEKENSTETKKAKKKQPTTLTRFTMFNKQGEKKNFGGWSNDGIIMFNSLVQDVEEDKSKHPSWDEDFKQRQVALGTKTKTRKKRIDEVQSKHQVKSYSGLAVVNVPDENSHDSDSEESDEESLSSVSEDDEGPTRSA